MQSYISKKFTPEALAWELADANNIFHLIYYNGQPAGYSKIVFDQPLEHLPLKNITKLERLYLLQEYYSLKLGHALLQFNIGLSKQNGQKGMWLYVWKENERALSFYIKASSALCAMAISALRMIMQILTSSYFWSMRNGLALWKTTDKGWDVL